MIIDRVPLLGGLDPAFQPVDPHLLRQRFLLLPCQPNRLRVLRFPRLLRKTSPVKGRGTGLKAGGGVSLVHAILFLRW